MADAQTRSFPARHNRRWRSALGVIEEWAGLRSGAEVIVDGPTRLTWADLADRTAAVAAILERRGVGRGATVVTFLPNCHEAVVVAAAAASLGAVLVPGSSRAVADEVAHRLAATAPDAVVTCRPDDAPIVARLAPRAQLVGVGAADWSGASYEGLLADGAGRHPRRSRIAPDDTALVMFTSGSTGRPRGTQLTSRNLVIPSRHVADRLGCTPEDVHLVPLPIDHMFGLVLGLLVPMLSGGRVILMPRHSAAEALALIDREGVTVHCGVPTMMTRELDLLAHEPARRPSRGTLRTGLVSGAIVGESLVRRLQSDLGLTAVIGYGSTETVNVSVGVPGDPLGIRATTAGRPTPGNVVRVADPDGRTVPPGTTGELLVKGPGVTRGYLRSPEETRRVFDDEGWFRTGDLGSVGTDGYVRVVGRCKDLIIRGGYNIVPAEVEAVLTQVPGVIEAYVVGVPDRDLGEVTCAFLVADPAGGVTAQAVRQFAARRLGKFEVPDRISVLAEVPRLANGKVDRLALKRLSDPGTRPTGPAAVDSDKEAEP